MDEEAVSLTSNPSDEKLVHGSVINLLSSIHTFGCQKIKKTLLKLTVLPKNTTQLAQTCLELGPLLPESSKVSAIRLSHAPPIADVTAAEL